jgi:hypothetical protein
MCSPIGDAEFLRLLKEDIEYYESAVQRFEDLIPHVSAPIQDQWRLQAQVRRNFALELEILYAKAQVCAGAAMENESGKKPANSAEC